MQNLTCEGVYKNGVRDGPFTFRKVFHFLLFRALSHSLPQQDEREKSQRNSKRARKEEEGEDLQRAEVEGVVVYRDGAVVSCSHPDLFQFLGTAPWCIESQCSI